MSGRRFMSDLRQAHALGYTGTLPHYNSIFRYLEDAALTPLLRNLIERKFGDFLRSKTDAAMVNKTLCKILAHNLVVLIHEMYELGIDPRAFGWDSPAPALEPPA